MRHNARPVRSAFFLFLALVLAAPACTTTAGNGPSLRESGRYVVRAIRTPSAISTNTRRSIRTG